MDVTDIGVCGVLDTETAAWVAALRSRGPSFDSACVALHARLLRIALAEAQRRGPRHRIQGPELNDLAHQAAADALMKITGTIGRFRGESRFTTWAYKFVIFELSAKLGRHVWHTGPIPLTAEDWQIMPDRADKDPLRATEMNELRTAVLRAVHDDLTERQRRVFFALTVHNVPMDALALELGMTRNAVYKTMFDARAKIRAHLTATGLLTGR